MARIGSVTREDVPDDQLEAFDQFVKQRGNVPTTGPFSVMLLAPEMLTRGEHLRAYLRGEESSLPANIREFAILVTARELDCQFIWNAHATFGRESGLKNAVVDNLRDKRPLTDLSPQESAVMDYGRDFFRTRRVTQGTLRRRPGPFWGPRLDRTDHINGLLRAAGFQYQRLRGRSARGKN